MLKSELIEALQDERQEIQEMLEDLPDEALLEPGVIGDWSIKDILNHLTFWEGQIVTLLFQAQRGVPKPSTVHFGKESVDELNKRWYETGKERPLEMVWKDWLGVRAQTIRRVGELSEDELNNPKQFPWLEGVPLYQWIINDTIDHEEEHADQISDWLEEQGLDEAGGESAGSEDADSEDADSEHAGSNGHNPN